MYHSKTGLFFTKWGPKSPDFEWFSLDRFIYKEEMVVIYKRSRLIAIRNPDAIQNPDKVDHSKSGHVRISDPHCNLFFALSRHSVQKLNV